jgi:hypothetical protein
MIEDEIHRLVDRDAGADLGRLESDIWVREAGVRSGRDATRRLASWQAAVMIFAIIGSAAVGSSLAFHGAQTRPPAALLSAENLAPSALLFGGHL